MSTHHKIILWPLGETVEVESEVSLLKALKSKGYPIRSSCGGVANCSDCLVKVLSGQENLTPPTFEEMRLLGNVFHITKERLSCQTKVLGDATIDISEHTKIVDVSVHTEKRVQAQAKQTMTRLRKKSEIEQKKKDSSSSSGQAQRGQRGEGKSDQKVDQQGKGKFSGPKQKGFKEGGLKRPRSFKYSEED